MKQLLNPAIFAVAGFASFAALTSCSKEARQEAAAEDAAEGAVDVMEDYAKLLESIKDKASAEKAIADMDKIADKFGKVAEDAKKAAGKEPDAKAQAKMQEDMKPLQERIMKAAPSAMTILASEPVLLKGFQEKSMKIATKMQEAAAAAN